MTTTASLPVPDAIRRAIVDGITVTVGHRTLVWPTEIVACPACGTARSVFVLWQSVEAGRLVWQWCCWQCEDRRR